MVCPQTIVRLYSGMMKAYVNQSNTYEGSTVVVEHQDKDQAVGLELAESFLLCGHQAFKTHIKNIAVFIHKDDRMEVAQGHFNDKEGEGDLTRLESGMSFMQVRASMSMKEKLRQVREAICVNRREIAHTRLEAIAGADNPYSLITIFRRGHLVSKAGGAVYVTRCSPVEVLPRSHKNCTEEIPVTVNGTDAFVDPISYVIKSAGSPIHCNDVPPPEVQSGGASGTAATPSSRNAMTLLCCRSMKSGSTLSRSTTSAWGRASTPRNSSRSSPGSRKGDWGLPLSSAAQGSLIDIVRASFFPLYRVLGPMIFFLSLLLLVWGGLRLIITVLLRVVIIVRCKGCGIWVLTAFWGTLFQLAISPFNWVDAAMEGVGVRVGQMMETEAA
jgi:hypothetical protein